MRRKTLAATVNTTTGPIAVGALGRTLIHEHVLVGFPGWFMDRRQPPFRRAEAVARVVEAFSALHDYGVRTVVDPCPMDMGRDVEMIAEVAQRSGINLICTIGAYTEQQGIPNTFRNLEVEAITEIYICEIEDGVGRTGIKAGPNGRERGPARPYHHRKPPPVFRCHGRLNRYDRRQEHGRAQTDSSYWHRIIGPFIDSCWPVCIAQPSPQARERA
jgi:hypothetical protein